MKVKIGITGHSGFIGYHLFQTLLLEKDHFEVIEIADEAFSNENALRDAVQPCDILVHLAAVNRHPDPDQVYDSNLNLVRKLIQAIEAAGTDPHVIYASSTQEILDNPYGRSKHEGRLMLEKWADAHHGSLTSLVIPNVFGPFNKPFYNSVIATFSHQLVHGEQPKIDQDKDIRLIYVTSLIEEIIQQIREPGKAGSRVVVVEHNRIINVSQLLSLLTEYKSSYLDHGVFPNLELPFDRDLFNTFRSFIPLSSFPKPLIVHADQRGNYVETARSLSKGQSSFSTTFPGITRGNHFHRRKIERFMVIRGEASIKLRKIGTNDITELVVSGEKPSFVDMPVWYTHNITNTGKDELVTLFWTNELYDPSSPDTYPENV